MVNAPTESKADASSAIIVDLGKRKRKSVKKLRKGSGPLLDEVNDTIDELVASGTIAKSAQPVVIVVREKPRRRGLAMGMLPKMY